MVNMSQLEIAHLAELGLSELYYELQGEQDNLSTYSELYRLLDRLGDLASDFSDFLSILEGEL